MDIEIARKAKMENICNVGKKLGLSDDKLILYGNDKAKIKDICYDFKGKLILVTSISPTPYGEGKTTVSIGLTDALRKLGYNSVAVLREPSMGPVFGMKGGATGGGYSQIVPMEDINLHFTGDFHAITVANNLLCAAIDNHIHFGNSLDIQEVLFHRCMDVNDRSLRDVKLDDRQEYFSITAASEMMALFCLADSLTDLKRRLGNIIVGYNSKKEFVYAKDLEIEGSLLVLLKDAFLPNLVQTLEGNPAIVHGGPFANVAHGCNSVTATYCGLTLGDYVITEAGFGADLGAEKFLDIKCRNMGIAPKTIVLVATIKALKYHGGVSKEDILIENVEAVKKGLSNLVIHIENLKKYGVPIVVCLNKYKTDGDLEIKIVEECCIGLNVPFSVSSAYIDGGKGAESVALEVVKASAEKDDFKLLYDEKLSIREKIEVVAMEIYRSSSVEFSPLALEQIEQFEKNGIFNFPICVSKTQYSLSDDAKKVGFLGDFSLYVKSVQLYNGAEFFVVSMGNILTMPALPMKPNYLNIDMDINNNDIIGLN